MRSADAQRDGICAQGRKNGQKNLVFRFKKPLKTSKVQFLGLEKFFCFVAYNLIQIIFFCRF